MEVVFITTLSTVDKKEVVFITTLSNVDEKLVECEPSQ